jgi:tripartite-type tricarboxylate transporter receptor subunit TctC
MGSGARPRAGRHGDGGAARHLRSPELPVSTLAEFIAYAKDRPGRLNYASAGNGSIQHIAGALFGRAIGTQMAHVPYRGAAPALQDVAGGRVEMFITTPSSAIGLVRGGRLKALAIASDARISALPEVPTTAEAGLPWVRGGRLVRVLRARRHAARGRRPPQRGLARGHGAT